MIQEFNKIMSKLRPDWFGLQNCWVRDMAIFKALVSNIVDHLHSAGWYFNINDNNGDTIILEPNFDHAYEVYLIIYDTGIEILFMKDSGGSPEYINIDWQNPDTDPNIIVDTIVNKIIAFYQR